MDAFRIVVRLGLCALVLATAFPQRTFADDAGPRREVRAIRHDLPALLTARILNPHPRGVQIDSVVSNGLGEGLVQWHDGDWVELDRFQYRYKTWWLSAGYHIQANGSVCCNGSNGQAYALGPTSYFLSDVGVPQSLIPLASEHVPIVQTADERVRDDDPTRYWGVSGDDPIPPQIDLSRQNPGGAIDCDPYEATIAFGRTDSSAATVTLRGRAPTEAESWVTFGGNSYFFFSGTVQSNAPIHVAAGTTIDVWFPFVLDPSLFYGLTIAHADKPIGPIDGTLENNVVHFVLPAFTLPPGAALMGEIEGDRFRHES